MPDPKMKIAVERAAGPGCRARFLNEEPIAAFAFGNDQSRSVVTYNIEGHATSTQAFAWVIGGGLERGEPKFRVVLSSEGIKTGAQAIKFRANADEHFLTDGD